MKFSPLAAAIIAAVCFAQTAVAGSPASLHAGSHSPYVTQLEQYLHANRRMDLYKGPFDGVFGPMTNSGLRTWQKLAGYPMTGSIAVGSSQWNQLRREATVERLAGYINQSAIQAAGRAGWAVDASKSPGVVSVLHYDRSLRLVVVTLSISAAYGGYKADDGITHSTTNGVFRIYARFGPDFVSRTYDNAPMPYAACFNGGQCLHYDGLYPSHGCIHIPSMTAAKYINSLPIGTTVVVHE